MEQKIIYAKNSKEWRKWLAKNHDKEKNVAILIYKKHTGKPSMSHQESMDEAICFGWIDTTLKRIDDDTYIRKFARRNKNSRWSRNTLRYGERLIKEKRMTPAGLKFYKEGLKKLPQDHNRPKNPRTPQDLKKAVDKNKKAKENFKTLAPSYKKTFLYWLASAKLPETRKKRIKQIVTMVAEKKRLGVN